ncbi:MAG: flagellar basal body P-ring formation protein FlgA [Zoogloeaceae bacterium]|jgi:flagella basal body P-ring formation protein FlgA|nr:flagellar basal body P-ring formation protein FlgA [Zoogloeaceae bacterium]
MIGIWRFVPMIFCFLPFTCSVQAQTRNPVLDAVEQYVLEQLQGQPGEIGVAAGPLDPRLRLTPCDQYQAFAPAGVRLVGAVNIGVRCLRPARWSIYVPVRIRIQRAYVATAVSLPAGRRIERQDLQLLRGDLGNLPAGVLTTPEAAVGKTLKNALAAGQPLRPEQLMAPLAIRQGQTVKLVYEGPGFTASNEGQALNNASEGQPVQVRTRSGTVVGGIAAADGTVRVGDAP